MKEKIIKLLDRADYRKLELICTSHFPKDSGVPEKVF